MDTHPMLHLRHTILVAAALCALSPLKAAAALAEEQPAARDDQPASRDLGPDPCLQFDEHARPALKALRELQLTEGQAARPIVDVRFSGLKSLQEAELWRLIGRKPEGVISTEQAAVISARTAETGLFQRVQPRLHVDADPRGAILELAVEELPRLERVRITGLTEVSKKDVLAALLKTPSSPDDHDEADEDNDEEDDRPHRRGVHIQVETDDGDFACAPPVPGRGLLARANDGQVVPGIVWEGLPAALTRVMDRLYDDGYLMATLEAELTGDGTLDLRIDEGRLESVEVHGVPPEVAQEVRKELGLEPGRVFVLADVERGVGRVEKRYPFLEKGNAHDGGPRQYRVVEAGDRSYRVDEQRAERSRKKKIKISVDGREEHSVDLGNLPVPFDWTGELPDYVAVEGRRAKVYFDQHRTDLDADWLELLRHTPVTGSAPGLGLSGWLYDPNGRAHLGVDAVFGLNLGNSQYPVDYLVGPKLQVPVLGLAEVGGQVYAITDTADRWRVSRLDSYLHSLLMNQPNADYFRRTGYTAFITLHLARQLTVAADYRQDVYAPMDTVVGTAWFGRIPAHVNRAIDPGRMGSLVARVEWSTRQSGVDKVGTRFRDPEIALVDRDFYDELEPGFQTVNTVEVADPRLFSTFEFVKVVSDHTLHIRTGEDQGLRIRFRAAGGRNLPLQKREALGGWNTLRGYDFKELDGDMSALVMAEYHFGFVSAFADGGSVHQATGWIRPKIGVGAALNFGSHVQVAAAWRTDERARLLPEVKAVINRTF